RAVVGGELPPPPAEAPGPRGPLSPGKNTPPAVAAEPPHVQVAAARQVHTSDAVERNGSVGPGGNVHVLGRHAGTHGDVEAQPWIVGGDRRARVAGALRRGDG